MSHSPPPPSQPLRLGRPWRHLPMPSLLVPFLLLLMFLCPTFALDFLFNSFTTATNLTLINDARIDTSTIRLTNDSNQFSFGRAFHPTTLSMKSTSNSSSLSSFSTAFVFSVLPELSNSPGFGLCFVLSNSTSPPGALASQYFGIFTNATDSPVAPLLAIEFDTGLNPEFNDPDENHIGIDLNNVISAQTAPAEYFNSSTGSFVPVNMRTGQNVHAWIDFDGVNFEINVTVAPVGVPKPSRPTLNYKGPVIANYVSSEMFVGFSASKTQWVEAQRILAWSFSDTGVLREINTTGLPIFFIESSSSSLSSGAIAGINLVQMRGWCRKGNELMLIYDYMPNGSLNRWIFDKPQKLLGWRQRLLVLADVAEGLNYLHHGWDQVVVHRDIKSSNILLDSEMRGRLGDFGLAKLYEHGQVPKTTRVVGTLGYLAPELATVAVPTAASDVYSFGVVVLEVVGGRRPLEMATEKEEEQVLIDWVRYLYAEGRLREAADARIREEYEGEEVEMVLKLGLACCHPDTSRRPTMKEVAAVLLGEEVAAAPAELLNDLTRGGSTAADDGHGGGAA
ncbi:Protein kinase domain - like 10 [Theobroma cacao]|nr:Protein kinase domain - like 10 [Theobroma cacao]